MNITEENTLLQVENVSKEFSVEGRDRNGIRRTLKALQNISFTLKKGETLGLVGESGCGKSTLGRVILRLIEPTSGRVVFDGADLTALPPKELRPRRRDFQMIFQDPYASFDARMTIRSILEEPLRTHRVPKNAWDAEIRRMLDVVELPHTALGRYPHEFSGGQRQRIGIARALILKPRMVVADEPVAALDVSIQAQVLNLLHDLQAEFGISLLFIAHNLASVEYVSHRIAVMYLGRIIELADTEELIAHPLHPYTRALISAVPVPVPRAEKNIIRLSGELPSPVDPPCGCAFRTRCPLAAGACAGYEHALNEVRPGHFVACRKVKPQEN